MTAIEFVTWAQRYYGPYPDGQKADIWHYLKELTPEYLDALHGVVVKAYSSKWGRPPDIAIFEQCRPQALTMVTYQQYLPPATEDLASPEEIQAIFAKLKEKIHEKN